MLRRISRRSPWAISRQKSATRTDEEHNYRNLLLNGAWFGFIDGGIVTYLPVFLARLGAGPSLVGLVTSGPALVGILSYILGGAYVERQDNLVRLATRASFVIRLSYVAIALLPLFLPPAYIPLVAVIVWTACTVANGLYIPAWTTVMQKAVPPQRRAHLNGTRWALYSLVSAATIPLFGFMLDRVHFPYGYQVVFVVSFLTALVNIYYFSKVRVPPFVAEGRVAQRVTLVRELREAFRPLAECPEFVRYNLGTLVFRLVQFMPVALYSIYWVDNLQSTDTWIGLRGTVAYAALVIGYRLWGQIANRLGHRTLLLLCGALLAFYPTCTGIAPTMAWMLPVALIWGIATAGTDIGMFDMLLAVCPEGRQPRFVSTANMLISVVTFVGPLLGAALAHVLGIRTALFVIGGLQVLATGLFLLLPGREQERLTA